MYDKPIGLHIESGYTDNKNIVKGLKNKKGSQNYEPIIWLE